VPAEILADALRGLSPAAIALAARVVFGAAGSSAAGYRRIALGALLLLALVAVGGAAV
jgi:hypothetical protein